MFLGSLSKSIAPGLERVAEQSEDDRSQVLAARAFRYPVVQKRLEVSISEPRRFNVLEEFVLRAGTELVDPIPTESELATVLGLDPIFVAGTVQTLRVLGALKATADGTIQLTEQGRQFFEQGSVPQPPRLEQIVACGDALMKRIEYEAEVSDLVQPDLPDLLDLALFDGPVPDPEALDLAAFQQSLQHAGNPLHHPSQGRIVTSVRMVGEPWVGWRSISLLALHDLVEGDVKLQARVGANLSAIATDWLTKRCAEESGLVNRLLAVQDEVLNEAQSAARAHVNATVAERQARYEAMAKARIVEVTDDAAPAASAGGSVRLVRDGQIRHTFINTITKAKHEILLFSPWISDQVVDSELLSRFQQAAKRGVFTIIGHGIASTPDKDDRPVPTSVVEALHAIRTPEGLPAVVLLWLGNSHAKEIVVDNSVHLSGSFNWLSYRGDYLPRGETVYEVTVPSEVGNSRAYYVEKFQGQANRLLAEGVATGDDALIVRGLAVLVGIGEIDQAWRQARSFDDPARVLDWLGLMAQRLRSGTGAQDDAEVLHDAFNYLAIKFGGEPQLSEAHVTLLTRLVGFVADLEPETAQALFPSLRQLTAMAHGPLPDDELLKLAKLESQKSRQQAESQPSTGSGKKKKKKR